ncbi:hypothetical protein EMIHUDRAFT_96355 [Emiliania huxleyi CCMP1516]|uniref:Protein kinase domain-containing protein n=2 Tax=Emiliania huxleyi TaxID=2903 RepID=A0A0D3ITS3_EMIH1|nr:hypothetical protein EMIHUDRAFT_96355 [Emiliania huxleyi CCMP1516]EOD14658.1 hypothetical protein EMIHUDRAFT_96355 [Emiliania huxleyi CCMP1516]|eukprot:XP_005767087.1 hypothetical protein EMIHUDRAFT_96355 [Emiliania huxleyi CCMP1516]
MRQFDIGAMDFVSAATAAIATDAAHRAAVRSAVRLSMLRERLVPPLDEWVGLVPRLQDELTELEEAGGSAPGRDLLHRLRDAWYEAEDALDKLLEQRPTRVRAGRPQPPPVPQAQLAAATRAVQQSERSLRAERARLSGIAASHFPELAVKEPLLQLGAAEGELFQRGGLLVERSLEQYSGPGGASSLEVLADLLSARHRVLRGEFGLDAHGRGVPCVLKEYVLDGEGVEWGKLVREVSVLAKLSDSPRFVEVQAVFQQARAGQNLAYLQLPYFEKRDVCHWLESDPPPSTDERRKMLRQLAEALQHLHSHGYAHGDVKLENVLMSIQATAHLADFESVREEPAPSAVRSASRSAGGGVRTMRYVAPERRSGLPGMSKPSAASDMYAYGVCALLACCDGEGEGEVVFDAAEQLRGWSRDAASSAGGPHLPALLDALLDLEQPAATSVMDALARRLSAKQVLLHPFLDTSEEIRLARLESEMAAAAMSLAGREEAAARQRREAEERRLEWEAAERERDMAQRAEEQQKALEQQLVELQRREAEQLVEAAHVQEQRQELQRKEEQVSEALTQQRRSASEIAAGREQVARLQEEARRERAAVEAEERRVATSRAQLERRRQQIVAEEVAARSLTLWGAYSGEVHTENAVRAFFARRQRDSQGGPQLRVSNVVKVENAQTLSNFHSSGSFYIDPAEAFRRKGDTLLFHGLPQEAATNVQATGLLLSFAANGMLGRGLYGAPDPRKSLQYCRSANKFMFICRYNLASPARHAGPSTQHRNSIFDEFCVHDERRVVVLWMLKLE